MERDFLSLSLKQETSDAAAAPLRSPTMHWPFLNKASSIHQSLSFQEEKGKAGFGSLSMNTDAFHSDCKAYVAAPQKIVVSERNGATTYPVKHHDSHMMIHHKVGNPITLSIAAPGSVHRPFDLSLGSQPLASVPLASPVTVVPCGSPVVGRMVPRSGGGSTQLTIFYNGSVSVYENITPDKAQAIMLLAGKGPPMPSPRPPVNDPFVVSSVTPPRRSSPMAVAPLSIGHPANVISCTNSEPRRSSPMAVAPLSIGQPANVISCTKSESVAVAAKPNGVFMSSSVIAEPLRLNKSFGSAASMKFHSHETVPQFRKKSLARFLEKRRERAINASPYVNKEQPDCSNSTRVGGCSKA